MTLYPSMVFVHVVAASIIVASSLVGLIARAVMSTARDLQSLGSALGIATRLERVAPFAGLVTLGTGIYLGMQGWQQAAWFWGALSVFLLNVVLAAAVVGAAARRLQVAIAAAGSGPITIEVDALRSARAPAVAANLMLAGDVATLFLMTNKPAFTTTLASCSLAFGLAVGVSLLGLRRAARSELVVREPVVREPVLVDAVVPSSERVTVPA